MPYAANLRIKRIRVLCVNNEIIGNKEKKKKKNRMN